MLNYYRDIKQKKISYRKYKFEKKTFKVIKNYIKLQNRDKYEYYFHIVKNLLLNYIKFINQKNQLFLIEKEIKNLKYYFGVSFSEKHFKIINNLIIAKKKGNWNFSEKLDKWIINFIKDFKFIINKKISSSKKIIFFRHAITKMNDGSFLGQKRDPSIDFKKIKKHKKNLYEKVYVSPLNRCLQSVKIISKNRDYVIDKRLLEIDYGKAEGLNIKKISKKFPKLVNGWKAERDPKFPSGESLRDVNHRLDSFLKKLIRDKSNKSCVVSHNVLIRCLVGRLFNIPVKFWHKIYIPHLMDLEFMIINNKIFPNINRQKLKILFSNLEK